MVSLSTCLPRCELNVHIVQDVITVRAMTQMPKNLVNTHYYTLLHITAYITIIEPCLLARTLDKQVLIEANLQDTSWKGGSVHFAHQVCVTIYIYIYCQGWRHWDHPGWRLQGPWLSQRCPLLQPQPGHCRQCWFRQWGRRLLPKVICEFLGSGPTTPELSDI